MCVRAHIVFEFISTIVRQKIETIKLKSDYQTKCILNLALYFSLSDYAPFVGLDVD